MDWIAFALTMIGLTLNIKKLIWCWPVWILSDIVWGIYAYKTGQSSLLVTQIIFIIINIWGWKCWWSSSK